METRAHCTLSVRRAILYHFTFIQLKKEQASHFIQDDGYIIDCEIITRKGDLTNSLSQKGIGMYSVASCCKEYIYRRADSEGPNTWLQRHNTTGTRRHDKVDCGCSQRNKDHPGPIRQSGYLTPRVRNMHYPFKPSHKMVLMPASSFKRRIDGAICIDCLTVSVF